MRPASAAVPASETGTLVLARLAKQWAPYGPPTIVFNKSHSGSRLLARFLADAGLFMGNDRNEAEDSADILRLVRPLVEHYYPNYSSLLRDGNAELEDTVNSVFEHLRGHRPGRYAGRVGRPPAALRYLRTRLAYFQCAPLGEQRDCRAPLRRDDR